MDYQQAKVIRQGMVDSLPLMFAFSNEQLEEIVEKARERGTKVCNFGGGMFCLSEDKEAVLETLRFLDETKSKDMDDYEFAYSAFLYEMNNHEYAINWQRDYDVFSVFWDVEYGEDKYANDYLKEVGADEDTVRAFYDAKRQHMKEAEQWAW